MKIETNEPREPSADVATCAALPGTQLWRFVNWMRPGNYDMPMLTLTVPAGDAVHRVRARQGLRQYAIDPSELLVFEPGEVTVVERMQGRQPREGETTILGLMIPVELDGGETGNPQLRIAGPVLTRPTLVESVRRVFRSLQNDDHLPSSAEEMLLALLDECAAAAKLGVSAKDARCDRSLRVAREFIESQAHLEFTLDELARCVGQTKWHVVRTFKREYGVTPGNYARAVRVRRALERIRGGVPLAAVGRELGFCDQSHLSRELKRGLGVTPSGYAKALRRSAVASSRRQG